MRSPQANAFAERLVKTLRHEVLDWTLILGHRHLDRVLASYARHYNAERPHRGIDLRAPEKQSHVDPVEIVPEIKRGDLFGGLIHYSARAIRCSVQRCVRFAAGSALLKMLGSVGR